MLAPWIKGDETMRGIEIFNHAVMLLFLLCYSYQFFYLAAALLRKPKAAPEAACTHRLAILIAARNEQPVIGALLDSIAAQSYPAELLDVFVCADNCTDDTAAVARAHGAIVYERRNSARCGKGYVLDYLLKNIQGRDKSAYDAYIVLDADNILDPNFVFEIDRRYSAGYEIVTSRRNSKNYGDNWISAGYALWFLRESRYLNGARMALGTSCAVSGTGFLMSAAVLRRCGGWHYFLLTEDIEFSIANILRGEKIGYAEMAVLYDEQPTRFSQSWRQRLRWSKGYLQVFARYGGGLLRGIFRGSFSCYDMTMSIMPAAVLTGVSALVNLGAAIWAFSGGGDVRQLALSVGEVLMGLYGTVFLLGAVTTITEWRSIGCSTAKKIFYAFTFPLFMFTYIPICAASFFARSEWKPIQHDRCLTLRQIHPEYDRSKSA